MPADGPQLVMSPPTPSTPPLKSLLGVRSSMDSDRSVSPAPQANGINGHAAPTNTEVDDSALDTMEKLRAELKKTREEKEMLNANYRNLLSKLSSMKTTLGNKLKQDAEELDRREQLIQQLQAQNDDLSTTVETLKEELIASNEESERASRELDDMRSRALQEHASESSLRERELRETLAELEHCRLERDEWERAAMQDRVAAEESRLACEVLERELNAEREARLQDTYALDVERAKSQNLQSVLEDFQSAKDHELSQAVKDYENQLLQATQSLAEFKHRALTAELQIEETRSTSSRTQELEKEVKEKNLLIGKLRHEAVILNEHLVEALRRLRRSSNDTNVDRRLVTNVLLSFITTPRADAKRFEMLQLLASILSWTDVEREKAGLQRAGHSSSQANGTSSSSFWSRTSSMSSTTAAELDKTDETESFSRLWVEFLLTEASGGSTPAASPRKSNASLPETPISPIGNGHPNGLGLGGRFPSARRLPSFSSQPSPMSSTPSLILNSPKPPVKDSMTLHPE